MTNKPVGAVDIPPVYAVAPPYITLLQFDEPQLRSEF